MGYSQRKDDPDTKHPTILNEVRRRALAEFLRKHRELVIQPADDKQRGERKRRTSGLRREEVAQLARISATWYTRLEQGQEVRPSAAALGRMAEVLRLTPAERAYVFQVAQRADPNEPSNSVSESASNALERFVVSVPCPACVLDRYWTLLFWNAEWAALLHPWLSGPERNMLRYIFLDSGFRALFVEWETRARHLLAQFRVDFGKYIDDPKMHDLVGGLSEQSEFFQQIWGEQQILPWSGNERSFIHPERGLLKFIQTTLLPSADPSLKVIILQPSG